MKSKFFEEAKKESHLSDYDGAHLGAVAVYKNKFILAKAHNTHKTNPTQFYYNRYEKDLSHRLPRRRKNIFREKIRPNIKYSRYPYG